MTQSCSARRSVGSSWSASGDRRQPLQPPPEVVAEEAGEPAGERRRARRRRAASAARRRQQPARAREHVGTCRRRLDDRDRIGGEVGPAGVPTRPRALEQRQARAGRGTARRRPSARAPASSGIALEPDAGPASGRRSARPSPRSYRPPADCRRYYGAVVSRPMAPRRDRARGPPRDPRRPRGLLARAAPTAPPAQLARDGRPRRRRRRARPAPSPTRGSRTPAGAPTSQALVPGMAGIHPDLDARRRRGATSMRRSRTSRRPSPTATDDELMVGVLRIVAMVSADGCDAHTGAFIWGTGTYPVDSLPLRLWLFPSERRLQPRHRRRAAAVRGPHRARRSTRSRATRSRRCNGARAAHPARQRLDGPAADAALHPDPAGPPRPRRCGRRRRDAGPDDAATAPRATSRHPADPDGRLQRLGRPVRPAPAGRPGRPVPVAHRRRAVVGSACRTARRCSSSTTGSTGCRRTLFNDLDAGAARAGRRPASCSTSATTTAARSRRVDPMLGALRRPGGGPARTASS